MERDEHEMLIEYSEMTSFNFNSKEYQELKRDYKECKNAVSNMVWQFSNLLRKFTPAKSY